MNDFNTLFPNFLSQCAEMNRVLTPIAFVLLAIGVVSSTVTGHRSPSAYLRTVGRTFAIAAALAYLPTWSNEAATVVDTTVRETLHADPAGVVDVMAGHLPGQLGRGPARLGRRVVDLVVDVGDVRDELHAVALVLEEALELGEDDERARVADVDARVDRRPAGVDSHPRWVAGSERLQGAGAGVVQSDVGHGPERIHPDRG